VRHRVAPNPWRATLPAWRSRLVLGALMAGFAVLAGRAFYLQTMKDGFLQAKGDERYSRIIEVPAYRGRILDRNGEPLAVSSPVLAVWADPVEVQATSAQLIGLAQLLDMSPRELRHKLSAAGDRDFVSLDHWVPPETADKIAALKIPGVFQDHAFRRFYPGGEVTTHVVGFTNVDDVGQEGIELAYQDVLGGKPGSRRVIKDNLGQIVEDVASLRPAQEGRDVMLSLDARIQNIAYRALRESVERHRAKGGGIIALDVETGEVLALVNLPTYNPNNRMHVAAAQMRNRAVTDSFEPGSTMKPFTVALALERGKVSPGTVIQTAPGTLTVGTATIRDAHPEGALTVAEVIQKSSNIGAAKIALGLPSEAMWQMFEGAGFGSAPQLGFPGEAAGRVRPFNTWRPIEQATMAYGHGIAASLVQLARAYTMFARSGDIIPLSLVKVAALPQGQRVVSEKTAGEMRRMLEMTVQPGGTAPRAQIMGYSVAGKTGTAHKVEDGGYSEDKYIASFIGFAPASRPRLIIAVMIDEPHDGQYYGGEVAAPVFASVMSGALRLLGVPPDEPMKPIVIPAGPPAARENT
jgi:cell division protein FtsI (penicillin-binding protein 3)